MTKEKQLKKAIIFTAVTIFTFLLLWTFTASQIEAQYYLKEGQELEIKTLCPTTLTRAGDEENYSVRVDFMGIIPIKTVDVTVLSNTQVIPGGQVYGIKYYSDGLIVVSVSEVNGIFPAKKAGLETGDILISADGIKLKTNEQLQDIVNSNGKDEIILTFTRNGEEKETTITPSYDENEKRYKVGLWLCDSTAGIGTLTFYNPTDNSFGALGHGISQTETGIIMPLRKGSLVGAQITGIDKGSVGAPGHLKGVFTNTSPIANLQKNCKFGIFGVIEKDALEKSKPISIGLKEEIHEGNAKIRCTVDDTGVQEYDVEIVKINNDKSQKTRNMVIKITDPRLLEKTGGIVQGMSGSPIIQDGKLIGAVTHVLVNNPTQGYGIFIENMISASQKTEYSVSESFDSAA